MLAGGCDGVLGAMVMAVAGVATPSCRPGFSLSYTMASPWCPGVLPYAGPMLGVITAAFFLLFSFILFALLAYLF